METRGTLVWFYLCVYPRWLCPLDMGGIGNMGDISKVYMFVYLRWCARGTLGTWMTWGTLGWYICVCNQDGVLLEFVDMGGIGMVYMSE